MVDRTAFSLLKAAFWSDCLVLLVLFLLEPKNAAYLWLDNAFSGSLEIWLCMASVITCMRTTF